MSLECNQCLQPAKTLRLSIGPSDPASQRADTAQDLFQPDSVRTILTDLVPNHNGGNHDLLNGRDNRDPIGRKDL